MSLEALETLARPFPPEQITFRIGGKAKNPESGQWENSVFTYLDARQVAERLNEVDPVWQRFYEPAVIERLGYTVTRGKNEKQREVEQVRVSVACSISLDVRDVANAVWPRREDVGETIGDIDDDKLVKTAYSDAFKRAAVGFGVGAYLYSLPKTFVSDADVNYGTIKPAAVSRLREQYALTVNEYYLRADQMSILEAVLRAGGKWDETVKDALAKRPASQFLNLLSAATAHLQDAKLSD